MARTLSVEIVGDARSLNRALNSSQSTSKGLAKSLGNLGKVGVGVAGAAGVGALIYTLKTGIGEFQQAQKVTAQTAAVIKSTGGAARVTTKHVQDLSGSIMKYSGVDDEAVQAGANMLLTFKEIRNSAGKNNDIFDQATKTVTDMSVAFGTDASKSAIQLGKALNDPIKGVSALSKIGVTFTAQQKAQIKTLVDSGQTMKAQKIILAELHSEVGGSAEALGKTLPGQINIAKESFNNWTGELVAKTIPIIKQLVAWLRDHWPQIKAAIQGFWTSVKPTIVAIIDLLRAVASIVINNWPKIKPIVVAMAAVITSTLKVVSGIIRTFTALLRGDWSGAWNAAKETVGAAIDAIKARIDLALKAGSLILSAMSALGKALLGALGNAITAGVKVVKDAITGLFHKVIGWAKSALGIASPSTVFHEIGLNLVKGFAGGIGAGAGLLKKAVISIAKSVGGSILGGIEGIIPGGGGGGGGGGIVKLGRWLQGLGFQVGEHPAFGGVSEGHAGGDYGTPPNDHRSNHYHSRAIDVNWPGGGSGELRRLQGVFGAIKAWHPTEEMIEDAGSSNQHLHVALAKGGIVTRPTRALIGERGPEAVIPLGHGASLGGDLHVHFDNYIGSKQEVESFLRDAMARFSRLNARGAIA